MILYVWLALGLLFCLGWAVMGSRRAQAQCGRCGHRRYMHEGSCQHCRCQGFVD